MNGTNGTTLVANTIEHEIIKVVFILALLFGLVGHGLVLLVVIGKGTRRTASDMFILNLSVSDLAFLILSLAINKSMYGGTFEYSLFYCKFVWPMVTVTFFASVFTLTSMALHRCYGVLLPLKENLTAKQAMLWAGCIWVMSLAITLPLIVITDLSENKFCKETWSESSSKTYTVLLLLLQYVIPLFIIALAYIQIVRCLRHRKIPGTLLDKYGQAVSQSARRENIQIIKTVAVIVILFAVCLFPHELAGILYFFGNDAQKQHGLSLMQYSTIFQYIHSCLNPIVYGIITHQFRKEYKKYLLMLVCCSKYKRFTNYRAGSYSKSRSTLKSTFKKHDPEQLQTASSFSLIRSKSRKSEETDGSQGVEDTKI